MTRDDKYWREEAARNTAKSRGSEHSDPECFPLRGDEALRDSANEHTIAEQLVFRGGEEADRQHLRSPFPGGALRDSMKELCVCATAGSVRNTSTACALPVRYDAELRMGIG